MANQGVEWTKEEARRNLPPVSSFAIRQMGIKQNQITYANNIDELRKSPPGIIIAEATRDMSFIQNWFKKQNDKPQCLPAKTTTGIV